MQRALLEAAQVASRCGKVGITRGKLTPYATDKERMNRISKAATSSYRPLLKRQAWRNKEECEKSMEA